MRHDPPMPRQIVDDFESIKLLIFTISPSTSAVRTAGLRDTMVVLTMALADRELL
jgi:hypothetical protein